MRLKAPPATKAERFEQYTREALIKSGLFTITVEETAKFLGLGRGSCYELCRNNEIPCLKLGLHKLLVPVPALLRMLGEDGCSCSGNSE